MSKSYVAEDSELAFDDAIISLKLQGFKQLGATCIINEEFSTTGTKVWCALMYKEDKIGDPYE